MLNGFTFIDYFLLVFQVKFEFRRKPEFRTLIKCNKKVHCDTYAHLKLWWSGKNIRNTNWWNFYRQNPAS